MTAVSSGPSVASHRALDIACADANSVYQNIHRFRMLIALESDGWHIDFEPTNPERHGGGPHYVIDADTGAILYKRYDQ
jgi:hypothetical protein